MFKVIFADSFWGMLQHAKIAIKGLIIKARL